MYSRANPSPRYLQLLELNQSLHEQGEPFMKLAPEQVYTGINIARNAERVKWLIDKTKARSLLDYGAGKGLSWDKPYRDQQGVKHDSLKAYLGISELRCYDPAYPPFQEFPAGQTFDGVVAMDVLEHCPEEDLPWILDEMFGLARLFVTANVACYPAKKYLPNGENAHCTVRPVEWWEKLIEEAAAKYPRLRWEFWFEYYGEANDGKLEKAVFSNVEAFS